MQRPPWPQELPKATWLGGHLPHVAHRGPVGRQCESRVSSPPWLRMWAGPRWACTFFTSVCSQSRAERPGVTESASAEWTTELPVSDLLLPATHRPLMLPQTHKQLGPGLQARCVREPWAPRKGGGRLCPATGKTVNQRSQFLPHGWLVSTTDQAAKSWASREQGEPGGQRGRQSELVGWTWLSGPLAAFLSGPQTPLPTTLRSERPVCPGSVRT